MSCSQQQQQIFLSNFPHIIIKMCFIRFLSALLTPDKGGIFIVTGGIQIENLSLSTAFHL